MGAAPSSAARARCQPSTVSHLCAQRSNQKPRVKSEDWGGARICQQPTER